MTKARRQFAAARAAGNRRRAALTVTSLIEQLAGYGLGAPAREHRFHATRRWRFDLAYPDCRLAIEIDGGCYTGGRHVQGAGVRADCEKFAVAQGLGWRVLRVLPEHVRSGRAAQWARAIGGLPR